MISWILKHVDLDNWYILNGKRQPKKSFQVADIDKYYHLEKGTRSLNDEIIDKFAQKAKDIFKIWYKLDKNFKLRLSGEYPTTFLRIPYQYIVAMLCRIYGE